MKNKHNALIFYFIIFSMLFAISGCDKSVDNQNQELDLSQITATGTQGPHDFIGNIDLSDWSPSNYNAVVFGKSFWIQRYSSSDTLYFGGRLSGDSSSQSLKIYNWGNTNLSVKLQLSDPFFSTHDSVAIQPSASRLIDLYFLLPDTSNTVYNGIVTLRFSTQDSMILKLRGSRVGHDTGRVVVILPIDFSLAPAYPNPTDGQITFEFTMPQRMDALLKAVNKKNEVVATIAQGNYAAGVYKVSWNANLANGNYRVIFQAGNYISKGDIQVLR
jgi:hypothetical protein